MQIFISTFKDKKIKEKYNTTKEKNKKIKELKDEFKKLKLQLTKCKSCQKNIFPNYKN